MFGNWLFGVFFGNCILEIVNSMRNAVKHGGAVYFLWHYLWVLKISIIK